MDDQRDYAEERYNRDLCPGCDHSPCNGTCAPVLPAIVFTLHGSPSTHVRAYLPHFVAEAVLMDTLLDMGHVMSDVAEWHVETSA